MSRPCTSQAGRNIVITGGTRGLGRYQAESALLCGANHITITGRSEEDGGTPSDGFATESDLGSVYGKDRITYVQSDVRSDEDTHRLFDPRERAERGLPPVVHAASLNAGIFGEAGPDRVMERLGTEAFDRVMQTNCTGVFRGMRAFSRAAAQTCPRDPSLLLIKSIYGSGASAFSNAGYQASKFCVDGLTKQGAVEFAREDPENGTPSITVNSLSPGFVKTPMTRGFWDQPEVDRLVAAAHPRGEWVRPQDIGETATFLLNPPRGVTGVDIFVDNGAHAESIPNLEDAETVRGLTDEPCCGRGS